MFFCADLWLIFVRRLHNICFCKRLFLQPFQLTAQTKCQTFLFITCYPLRFSLALKKHDCVLKLNMESIDCFGWWNIRIRLLTLVEGKSNVLLFLANTSESDIEPNMSVRDLCSLSKSIESWLYCCVFMSVMLHLNY